MCAVLMFRTVDTLYDAMNLFIRFLLDFSFRFTFTPSLPSLPSIPSLPFCPSVPFNPFLPGSPEGPTTVIPSLPSLPSFPGTPSLQLLGHDGKVGGGSATLSRLRG